jgi:hypothetical protein
VNEPAFKRIQRLQEPGIPASTDLIRHLVRHAEQAPFPSAPVILRIDHDTSSLSA